MIGDELRPGNSLLQRLAVRELKLALVVSQVNHQHSRPRKHTTESASSTSSKSLVDPWNEVSIMAKGNNAQGKDKKKAKAAPKKDAKPAQNKTAAPKKKA
jgi:hypothetical protein